MTYLEKYLKIMKDKGEYMILVANRQQFLVEVIVQR